MTFFPNNEIIPTLERTSDEGKSQKENIMEKITLKKIIGAVRDLEVKKSVNDSQFEFYNKKKHRIERKEKRMIEETGGKKALEYYKNNKEIIISITKNGITSKMGMYAEYYQNMIINLINNHYCYLWQSETDSLIMLNRHTGDKIEFKIL